MSSAVDDDRTTTVAPSSPPIDLHACREWDMARGPSSPRSVAPVVHDEAGEHGKSSSGRVGQVGGLGAGQRGVDGVGRVERDDVRDGCRAHAPTPCVGASMRSSTAGRMSSTGGLVPTVAALGQSSNTDAISAATHRRRRMSRRRKLDGSPIGWPRRLPGAGNATRRDRWSCRPPGPPPGPASATSRTRRRG